MWQGGLRAVERRICALRLHFWRTGALFCVTLKVLLRQKGNLWGDKYGAHRVDAGHTERGSVNAKHSIKVHNHYPLDCTSSCGRFPSVLLNCWSQLEESMAVHIVYLQDVPSNAQRLAPPVMECFVSLWHVPAFLLTNSICSTLEVFERKQLETWSEVFCNLLILSHLHPILLISPLLDLS